MIVCRTVFRGCRVISAFGVAEELAGLLAVQATLSERCERAEAALREERVAKNEVGGGACVADLTSSEEGSGCMIAGNDAAAPGLGTCGRGATRVGIHLQATSSSHKRGPQPGCLTHSRAASEV